MPIYRRFACVCFHATRPHVVSGRSLRRRVASLDRQEANLPVNHQASEAALRGIPVIDLTGGQVVRARMGDRASYRPLGSPLSPTSDAVDVVRGLLGVFPFPALYVADLDAIQGSGDNSQTLRRIRAAFPSLQVWVDNGVADASALDAFIEADLGTLVIGRESQRDSKLIAQHL